MPFASESAEQAGPGLDQTCCESSGCGRRSFEDSATVGDSPGSPADFEIGKLSAPAVVIMHAGWQEPLEHVADWGSCSTRYTAGSGPETRSRPVERKLQPASGIPACPTSRPPLPLVSVGLTVRKAGKGTTLPPACRGPARSRWSAQLATNRPDPAFAVDSRSRGFEHLIGVLSRPGPHVQQHGSGCRRFESPTTGSGAGTPEDARVTRHRFELRPLRAGSQESSPSRIRIPASVRQQPDGNPFPAARAASGRRLPEAGCGSCLTVFWPGLVETLTNPFLPKSEVDRAGAALANAGSRKQDNRGGGERDQMPSFFSPGGGADSGPR